MLKKQHELAAVKVVFLKEDEIKETLLEMEILQACDHPNITKFYGSYLKGLDLWVYRLLILDLHGILWCWIS
jgi:serine/threonine protein kinase